ncbi:MAG: DEAD/DEAH box helicase family protein [Deltaproteobacteria bacterium]|nr:DEAD/DEAH box helicase family protein [Deltaproteobacteria bacterium]
MRDHEVPDPIQNSPFEEPQKHWLIREGEEPALLSGRRPAMYFYREPSQRGQERGQDVGIAIELKLVNRIRERVKAWRDAGYPGATRTTLELLHWWRRDGRLHRLFFAQLEAAETVIFFIEARADLRQGLNLPPDEPGEQAQAEGCRAFRRYACKMATGAGKTMVMGMLAAWSILNKVNDRSDGRFSDVVLVVCPNVTIRHRLEELRPEHGEASIYRKRDLVAGHLMPSLGRGRVLVTNWHVFELQSAHVGEHSGRVLKTGVPLRKRETVIIGPKTTTARGSRYLTRADFDRQIDAGLLTVLSEERDNAGELTKVVVETVRHVESDAAFVNRVLGRDVGRKQNILVFNDEAHHAYRIKREEPDPDEVEEEEEDAEEFFKEATVWIDGLDRINKRRGINFCVDLSATPYYLGRVGQEMNRPFPWVVSDFGLIEAIESGLVKIPQLAMRDTTGAAVPGYFNVWEWIIPQLTPAERGGKRASPKPEAILKYAHTPIAMLGGLWDEERRKWEQAATDPRPPVFILVCKNTAIAKVVYEWLAEGTTPAGVAPSKLGGFRNRDGRENTIRVDSKVVLETDTGEAKGDDARWMRLVLDTVGKTTWPTDGQGRPIFPEGFEELARKRDRSLDPPGRDVRCIVSVGMLTEGWDCNTVTHIIGLRPFMSQLLCEQVVGRALRRVSYDPDSDGKLHEEIAQVFGVPFQVAPFKAQKQGQPREQAKRNHVRAIGAKAQYEIRFPRVEGYTQAIRNRVALDWESVAPVRIEPSRIPPEVEVKAGLPSNRGRPSLLGPGRLESITLNPFRTARRMQELVFDLAQTLTREVLAQGQCQVPPHALFPQLARIVTRYLGEKVVARPPAMPLDVFLSPYYGWVVEHLLAAVRPDTSAGEAQEVPRYESSRGPGSTADVDYWTLKDVREVLRSHVNYVVADTRKWEQQAAYHIDKHPQVEAFVKNAGLGFAIPYFDNGQMHDYQPDFIIRLRSQPPLHLILETKGFDPTEDAKCAGAKRWVDAVNADGHFGTWRYAVVKQVSDVPAVIRKAAEGR